MAKLPTSLLPRSLPATSTSTTSSASLLSSTHRPTLSASSLTNSRPTQQVRHATRVERPKRPFTWTQIIQLSDGSTYTTRTTAPLSVFRSTKDTRNHARWQPSDPSLQNVEVDEAGKLASFRKRFGGAFDLAPSVASLQQQESPALEAEQAVAAALGGKGAGGKKKIEELKRIEEERQKEAAAAAEAAKAEEEGDFFTDLLSEYVVDQPQLKGGRIGGKEPKKGKKK